MKLTYLDEDFIKSCQLQRITYSMYENSYTLKKDKKIFILTMPHDFTDTLEDKLNYLVNIEGLPIYYPFGLVEANNGTKGYIAEVDSKKSYDSLTENTKKECLHKLVEAKEKLDILHDKNIIHSNIEPNGIYMEPSIKFSSIHSFIVPELDFQESNNSFFLQKYLEKTNQIDMNLDIYEFNIMTYCLISKISSPYLVEGKIKRSINENNFGVFKNENNIELIKRLTTFKDSYQDKYLIDNLKRGIW